MMKKITVIMISVLFSMYLLLANLFGLADLGFGDKKNENTEFQFSGKTVDEVFSLNGKILPVFENGFSESVPVSGFSEDDLIVGGDLVGVRIKSEGIIVTELGSVETENGNVSPAEISGIKCGDTILKADGVEIESVQDFSRIISKSKNASVTLLIKRGTKNLEISLKPELNKNGEKKAGIWVKDRAAGIGTVTFRSASNGSFAALGHGIVDSNTSTLLQVKNGNVYEAVLIGIQKSKIGDAGEIKGSLTQTEQGSVFKNSCTGIYGTFRTPASGEKTAIKHREEVKCGDCKIICTVSNQGKQEYSAKIEQIIDKDAQTKNFIIRVTDKDLLELTGGIVQGMSGSPILQDGKLVGAVTHVLVNDPTKGYGIFIENMLENVQETTKDNYKSQKAS